MANHIPNEVIEEIRKSNNIVEVVEEYVQLKKQGQNYIGLCPFHDEKTPSFSVSAEKQIFKCFGCGKSGNVFGFLMEIEGYNFVEAVKFFAERSGITLPESVAQPENSRISDDAQEVLQAYDWMTKFYHHFLRYAKDNKEGYQYFKDRGITDETIDLFKLGYAPMSTNFTASFLDKKGFRLPLLAKAGLLSLREDATAVDRFSGRIIFPIRNHLGKTVGFAGRTTTGEKPKYLNSSESELFQKSKLLYNFDLAKKQIRKTGEVILFEGYMDVISAYQSGIENVVATMGTALTQVQARLLKRYVDTVIVCYDGDDAGIEASYKAAKLLRETGCGVKVANLSGGVDPDNFIQKHGGEYFIEKIVHASDTYISFLMRYLKRKYNLSNEGDRIHYIEAVIREIALLDSVIEREYYLQELANEFSLSVDSLKSETETVRKKLGYNQGQQKKDSQQKQIQFFQAKRLLPAFHNAEKYLLAHMLHDRVISEKVRDELGASFNIDAHKIIATHLYAYYEEGNPSDVSMFVNRLEDEKLEKLVIDLAMLPIDREISDRELRDYIQVIREQSSSENDIKLLKEQQKIAEQQSDPITAAEIAVKIIALRKQLRHSHE
ncbi:DNA primase [Virgibacillus sp. 179-BFC.A HS]|uniref:DNA primase n=1 Tax=Tigheibacillus jepli TaxID=3035914 RepID=A0ABU5CJ44_9BACI|nr:DNA primase [Virgibacillus sp. 179-BFC.A HS]MDY0405548.1 DNA primase [Virgibacillus sp. 179-BFC.A HS]